MEDKSIFQKYYENPEFVDRLLKEPQNGVDVIIPIIHTNELWRVNLLSLYREIPINRLLIGNGGCIDNSLEILKEFPRVKILDHTSYKSLGYSIRKLIEEVETEWFVYPHSDVYIPENWFNNMAKHQNEYDWFGCPMQFTVMVEYPSNNEARPYAGTQMGRKKAFEKGLDKIDDDYVYRQEDFIFADLVKKNGYKEGKVRDTFHYHQVMYRNTKGFDIKVKNVTFELNTKKDEKLRASNMQIKGVIKYFQPSKFYFKLIVADFLCIHELGELNWKEMEKWIEKTNPAWLKYIKKWKMRILINDIAKQTQVLKGLIIKLLKSFL